ncbi:hypothetical protein NPIL_312021 [Nephila pilipes]|uniref:Uncharacterized protein n=1 Tax=Nephila pilipes TaxID=299642 RepID=A0A8X6TMQ6_NEPPI|nr:hypothetical protein NPIL_312021 [Nephila pilipes]
MTSPTRFSGRVNVLFSSYDRFYSTQTFVDLRFEGERTNDSTTKNNILAMQIVPQLRVSLYMGIGDRKSVFSYSRPLQRPKQTKKSGKIHKKKKSNTFIPLSCNCNFCLFLLNYVTYIDDDLKSYWLNFRKDPRRSEFASLWFPERDSSHVSSVNRLYHFLLIFSEGTQTSQNA